MRYLSLLLIGPWLVLLAWAYWAVSRRSGVTWLHRAFDAAVIAIAFVLASACALIAYDHVAVQKIGDFGRESGGIWKQVMPALYGYGAFAGMMMVGIAARMFSDHENAVRAAEKQAPQAGKRPVLHEGTPALGSAAEQHACPNTAPWSWLLRKSGCHSCDNPPKRRHSRASGNPRCSDVRAKMDDSLRSPLRGRPSDVLRASRYVPLARE